MAATSKGSGRPWLAVAWLALPLLPRTRTLHPAAPSCDVCTALLCAQVASARRYTTTTAMPHLACRTARSVVSGRSVMLRRRMAVAIVANTRRFPLRRVVLPRALRAQGRDTSTCTCSAWHPRPIEAAQRPSTHRAAATAALALPARVAVLSRTFVLFY